MANQIPLIVNAGAGQIQQLATGDNLSVAGNVITNGILTDGYYYANGTPVSFGSNYGNANVAEYLPTFTGNLAGNNISLTGNVYTDGKILHLGEITGNGITANGAGIVVGANVATILYDNSVFGWTVNEGWHPAANVTYNLGRTTRYWNNFYAVNVNAVDIAVANSINASNFIGNLSNGTSKISIASSGNVSVGVGPFSTTVLNVNTSTGISVLGNIVASEYISATGNITGNYIFGNGSQLTGLPSAYGNTEVAAYLAGSAGNIIPGANLTYSLGNSTNWWSNVWVAGNTIYIGGVPLGMGAGNVLTVDGNAVLSNDSNTSISTTGNITANYFIGDGSQLTNLPSGGGLPIANGTSNFDIATVNGNPTVTSNGNTWTFNTDGKLLLPNNGVINTSDTAVDIGSDNSISLEANTVVNIYTDTNNAGYQWQFGDDGNLTLPSGGTLYSQGSTPSGAPGNTIILQPSGSGTITNQKLMLYPTAGDGDHLHMVTGNLYETELFLGSDNFYVKLANTGNVVINSNDNNGNISTWTFSADGYLTFPRDATGNTDPYLQIEGGPTPTIQSVDVSLAGPANLTIVSNYLEMSGSTGNTVTIYADNGEISASDYLVLTANTAGNTNSWLFDPTGSLTLPPINLGGGTDEQTVVQSQRKRIPSFRWSAIINGNTPTVVYTATNALTTSMKVTVQVQHSGLGMELFDVSATYTGADTYYTVSNRVAPPTIAASTVVVDLNGSNTMQITITIDSGATTSWVTYDAVEFGIPND